MRDLLAYDDIRLEPFEDLPHELWSREFFESVELVNLLTDGACLQVLESLDIDRDTVASVLADTDLASRRATVDALAARAGVDDALRGCFDWLFAWLGDVERPVGVIDIAPAASGDPRTLPLFGDLAPLAAARVPGVTPSIEMLALAVEYYPAFLRGEVGGEAVLFSPATLPLWERYFSNRHTITRALNVLGATACERVLGERRGLHVLELGGGLGSAAESLLERIGERVATYRFTDVHPGFLRRGAELVRERFADVELTPGLLDINRDFDAQRAGGPFDLVCSTNVLHLATDLGAALGRVASVLDKDGRLVFVEGARPAPDRPIAAELVFQLLPQYRGVAVDERTRPRPGFLAGEHWLEALCQAGFTSAASIPGLPGAVRGYPNLAMAAFIASR